MVLMAIDHVRVYSGLPAGGPRPDLLHPLGDTLRGARVHFPGGTSAFFYGRKHSDLSRFLLVRGAWLVLLELTVIAWRGRSTLDFANYLLAGVIWVMGGA